MSITRRRLFAVSGAGLAGGGAAAVLAACGTEEEEEPSAERDVELLNAVLAAQGTVATMYEELPAAAGPGGATLDVFGEEAAGQVERLTAAIEGAGGTPTEEDGNPPEGESATEALTVALRLAISACHDAAGELSTPELNATVLELVAVDAAQLAALRGLLGEEQAPEAFVTGLDEPPLVAKEQA